MMMIYLSKMKTLLTLISIIFFFSCNNSTENENNSISAQMLRTKIKSGSKIGLIDVRTIPEYNGPLGHINESISIPLSELNENIDNIKSNNFEEIYIICLSGSRSASAVKILNNNDIEAQNVQGGMLAWNKLK